ncbi:hypothetical protein RFI_20181 [Reticulomyxa filosa]|uniref:Uncharacterized protein n=1 Tax=Reticulomyxa filosa TaxID=46433 RepID=X6MTG8_RETFI|nr:hypothetical protein RFI_20181 [Reticulomyxa filosa]|eukprot:ETO17149.1 hypothetical protein RFI_20181 [Reticulomyxa filosa]
MHEKGSRRTFEKVNDEGSRTVQKTCILRETLAQSVPKELLAEVTKKRMKLKKELEGKIEKSKVKVQNEYWDRYNEIMSKLNAYDVSPFFFFFFLIKKKTYKKKKNRNQMTPYMSNPNSFNGLGAQKKKQILNEMKQTFKSRMQLMTEYSYAIPSKAILQALLKLSKTRSYQLLQVNMCISNKKDGFWGYLLNRVYQIPFNHYRVHESTKLAPHAATKATDHGSWFAKTIDKHVNDEKKEDKSKSKVTSRKQDALETMLASILKDFSHTTILLLEYCDYFHTYFSQPRSVTAQECHSDLTVPLQHPFRNALIRLNLFTLKHFQGEFVVHFGEFGRTTSIEVQNELARRYHKIYECNLPQWPGTKDTFSIWRKNSVGHIGGQEMKIFNDKEFVTKTTTYTTKFWEEL